jgi:hypothetical protein
MNATMMSLEEIRLIGLKALSRELGAVGLVRFLQQFETGYGDYTAERHTWLKERSISEIAEDIERERGDNDNPKV